MKSLHVRALSLAVAFVLLALLPASPALQQAHAMDAFRELSCATSSYSPFVLDPVADTVIGGAALTFAGIGLYRNKKADLPEWYERTYDKKDINSFDRMWYNKYSNSLDDAGTITCGVDLIFLPVLLFGLETGIGNLPAKELVTIGTMYAESFLLSYGLRNIIKTTVKRPRPYMYTSKWETDELDSHDFEMSFLSGHSADAFMGAGFVTYVFSQYFPDSQFKWPIIGGAYAFAVATGILRIASGNHFMTDVFAGAAFGTAIGYGIPLIHQKLSEIKYNGRQVLNVTPNGLYAEFAF